jgi:hypothetical protein
MFRSNFSVDKEAEVADICWQTSYCITFLETCMSTEFSLLNLGVAAYGVFLTI